jgi:hypothetical protein
MHDLKRKFLDEMLTKASGDVSAGLKARYAPPPEPEPAAPPEVAAKDTSWPTDLASLPPEVLEALLKGNDDV